MWIENKENNRLAEARVGDIVAGSPEAESPGSAAAAGRVLLTTCP